MKLSAIVFRDQSNSIYIEGDDDGPKTEFCSNFWFIFKVERLDTGILRLYDDFRFSSRGLGSSDDVIHSFFLEWQSGPQLR